jgi:hypothetical protein
VSGTSISETGDTEEIDALPVLAEGPTAVRVSPATGTSASEWRSAAVALPAVQAAAVAAGGFVAGAAVVGFVNRHRRTAALAKGRGSKRRLGRRGRGERASGRGGELLQIVGSRSLLVDVHLLGAPGGDR